MKLLEKEKLMKDQGELMKENAELKQRISIMKQKIEMLESKTRKRPDYGFSNLEVGEKTFIEIHPAHDVDHDANIKARVRLDKAAAAYSSRTGKKIQVNQQLIGAWITRLK